ncbi:hypothetical protein [Metapseudomonas furukawaii]
MQQITIIQLLASALAIQLFAWPMVSLWAARKARAAGYDEGHRIASQACNERIALLHSDIDRLSRLNNEERALHQLDRENLLQDADRRISLYARRALTEQDAKWLADAVKTLRLAADTFAGVYAWDKHQKALREAQELTRLHERLVKALMGPQEHEENTMEATA